MGNVQGTVTLDGEPLAEATLTFDPIGLEFGGASTGKTDANGMYTLDYVAPLKGAVVAEHTVRIDVVRGAPTEGDPLPAKYNTKTELKATIEAGDNVIDFDLLSK